MIEKIKEELSQKINGAVRKIFEKQEIALQEIPPVILESPKNKEHGDLATNIALQLSKILKQPPAAIAGMITKNIDYVNCPWIEKTEIAGPGFINFYLNNFWMLNIIPKIIKGKNKYGSSDIGGKKKVQVEFVSANPTGPLHVGHGRGAVVGDVLANILEFVGFSVKREYYINDSGNQMQTLGLSTWCRYQEMLGVKMHFPDNGYQGNYIKDIAKGLFDKFGDKYKIKGEAEKSPGKKILKIFAQYAANKILENIKNDLDIFGIKFNRWFSEKALHKTGQVKKSLDQLKEKGYLYEKDGAVWFKSTSFGDDKDRVVVTGENVPTYLAADIAYHDSKYKRGFEKIIDIWGADHHGYIGRVKAAVEALGHNRDSLDIILIQLVSLVREGKPVSMSKRSDEFITLQDVIKEVGSDMSRFFFLMRSCDRHLEFDLELAKKESLENPVYYVQYAYARISSICREAEKQEIKLIPVKKVDFKQLQEEEIELIKKLAFFTGLLTQCASTNEPHHLTKYLHELAGLFHSYYKKHKVIIPEQKEKMYARLYLVKSVQIVIRNGLCLLGVSIPEKM